MLQQGEKEEEIKEFVITRLDAVYSNYHNGSYADNCRKRKKKEAMYLEKSI